MNTVAQGKRASPSLPSAALAHRQISTTPIDRERRGSPRPVGSGSRDRARNSSSLAIDSSSSSSSDSEPSQSMTRSRAFARRPRRPPSKAPLGPLSDADEDEDGPFLPFSDARPSSSSAPQDPSATVKITPTAQSSNQTGRTPSKLAEPTSHAAAIHSSSSSAQSQPQRPQQAATPVSPRRATELGRALSPRHRRLKEGSDGTPSMGSSFSDLDDSSVTRSAMEEAYANELAHGGTGMASRMSTISQALRSKYL